MTVQSGAPSGAPTLLDAAIGYAHLDLAVFQLHRIRADGRCGCGRRDCDDAGKHPVPGGWQRSIPSLQFAEREWARFPNRGIGLATGPRSGCFAIDVDPDHGGDRSLATLVAEHGQLPRTWTARTGGGGLHIYFGWPELDVRNSAGKLGAGLDVRGRGGYTVLPPSPHQSGNRYRWIVAPDPVALAPAPAWLLDLIRDTVAARPRPAAGGELYVPAGRRHDVIVRIAGWLRNEGVGEAAIAECARAIVARHFEPGYEAELERAARDVARRYGPSGRFIAEAYARWFERRTGGG